MLRRRWVSLVFAAVLLAPVALGAAPRPAGAQLVPAPPALATILVDAGSGQVLAGQAHHTPLPPASTTKLMTALVVVEKLSRDSTFLVGSAPAAQPAMRIGIKAGQSWGLVPALHALLMVSANDAAYALAEAASGSLDAFAADMNAAAIRYGMRDSHFNDPAGFDDSTAFNGGSRVSAYDLAIAARNTLAVPELAAIAALPEYHFTGPDGDEHRLLNHNKLLRRYPGATGLKTGYTRLAGRTFVGTATHNGRTLIAVVLNADDTYGVASALLDQGFAAPADSVGTGERLPPVRVQAFRPSLASTRLPGGAAGAKGTTTHGSPRPDPDVEATNTSSAGPRGWLQSLLFIAGSAGAVLSLRLRAHRRSREEADRRRRLAEIRRREYLRVADPEGWDGGGPVERSLEEDVL